MSQHIIISATTIKEPELLKAAVEQINDLKQHGVIQARYEQNAEGWITKGYFTLQKQGAGFQANTYLKFEGTGAPKFTERGMVQNGHFRLMADGDFAENQRLGRILGDHYDAQVVKTELEARGHGVELEFGENGAITITGIEQETVAACNY
jgi:hypothetical protein